MGSRFGARRGLRGYDKFRTGLTYQQVFDMLKDNSDDSSKWRYKKRGTVLGLWHQLKMEMWARYQDALAARKRRKRRKSHVFEPAPF